MTDIKVHGLPPSTFTRTVLLACREKGVSYELVPAMPNDIGAMNPFRKIPAITHGDFVFYEFDGDSALSRSYFSRAEAVAGGFPCHRALRPMDQRHLRFAGPFGAALHGVSLRLPARAGRDAASVSR